MKKRFIHTALSVALLSSMALLSTPATYAAEGDLADAEALVFKVTPVITTTGATYIMNFPDAYWGNLIIMQVSSTKNGAPSFKTIDHFAIWRENGVITIKSPVKVVKGQTLRFQMGGRIIKSMKIS